MDRSGLTIRDNKVAEMLGIEIGDAIVKLNGQPINSPLNAWAYQKTLIKNPNQAEMQLDLRPGGAASGKPIVSSNLPGNSLWPVRSDLPGCLDRSLGPGVRTGLGRRLTGMQSSGLKLLEHLLH